MGAVDRVFVIPKQHKRRSLKPYQKSTKGRDLSLQHIPNRHNHDANAQKLQVEKLRVSLKRKAEADISARPMKLVKTELGHQQDTDMVDLDDNNRTNQNNECS